MIIFLFGPDAYRRRQKSEELTNFYRQKNPHFDFHSFDLSENMDVFSELKDFLVQPSLFSQFKMAEIRGIFEGEAKEIKSFLRKRKEQPNEVLLISEFQNPNKDFAFLREKPIVFQEFENLSSEKLIFFAEREAKKRNVSFDSEAKNYWRQWLAFKGVDTWTLINELDKIALAGLPQPLSAVALESLLPFSGRRHIFDLTEILASRQPFPQKLIALERILNQKEPLPFVFNLLASRARGDLLLAMADYDYLIKSGASDYEESLLDLVLSRGSTSSEV